MGKQCAKMVGKINKNKKLGDDNSSNRCSFKSRWAISIPEIAHLFMKPSCVLYDYFFRILSITVCLSSFLVQKNQS